MHLRTWLLGSLALVAAGVAVLASRPSRQAGFGWFAYAPLAEDQLDAQSAWNTPRLLGAGLVVLGVLVLALVGGLHLGRRHAPRPLAAAWVVGGLVLVGGLVAAARPRSFAAVGTEPDVLRTDVLLLAPVQVVALGLAALGLTLLVLVAGLALGGRRRERV